MRAPWDALLSEFNREFSTAFADSHVAHAPKDAVLRELAPWCGPLFFFHVRVARSHRP